MELEVRYFQGKVVIQSIIYYTEYERSARVIARSEELLSNLHLKDLHSTDPLADLKAYFERRGWLLVKAP